MRTILNAAATAILLMAVGLAQATAAECSPPDVPSLPDAATATEADVASAGRAVRTFIQAGNAYLECIDQREQTLGDTLSAEQKQFMDLLYNGTVDRMQLLANQYNALVRDVQAR